MKRFRKAGRKIIKQNHEQRVRINPHNVNSIERLSALTYEDKEYEAAINWFGQLVQLKQCDDRVWGALARSERAVWRADGHTPARLQRAVRAYQRALAAVERSPAAVGRYPHLLFELGRCYEDYGAWEGALKLYAQALELFPKFVLADQVTFRFALVLKHMSTLPEMDQHRGTLLQRAMGYCQQLMLVGPALPSAAAAAAAVPRPAAAAAGRPPRRLVELLYNRLCEELRTPEHRQLAAAGWEALYQERERRGEDLGGKFTWREWVASPETWVALAREALAAEERTLGVDLLERARGARGGELGYEALLAAARAYASFQRREEAVARAAAALRLRPLDPAATALLAQWSPAHRHEFEVTLRAARRIQRNWRERPWRRRYRARLLAQRVAELEARVGRRPLDAPARAELSYYARRKWRPVVLAEDAAARRIQRAARNKLSWERWLRAKREKHVRKLAALYRKWRKYPFDLALRELALRLVAHKDTPKDHKIRQLPAIFQKEEESAQKLQRQFYVWKARQFMKEIRKARAALRREREAAAAWTLQGAVRQWRARRELRGRREHRAACHAAAATLQRIWRGRTQKWNFFLRMMAIRKEKALKEARLRAALLGQRLWRGRRCRRVYRAKRAAARDAQRLWRGAAGRRRARERKRALVCRIQAAFRSHAEWERFKLLAKRMKLKRQRPDLNLGGKVVENMISQVLAQKGSVAYVAPGLDAAAPGFRRLLGARAIAWHPPAEGPGGAPPPTPAPASPRPTAAFAAAVAGTAPPTAAAAPPGPGPGPTFGAADCVLLGAVLRHPGCATEALLLREADLSNDRALAALVGALPACRTLKCLGISGCNLSYASTILLLETVRSQNFKIEKLIIESNEYGFADEGALHAGHLIRDYFHHQFGKFHFLSLTQNWISDVGAIEIGKGLEQNSLLVHLNLCDNFIDSEGAIAIAKALRQNCSLKELNLADNRITVKGAAALVDALVYNRSLSSLSLSNNLIQDEGLNHLGAAIRAHPALQTLNLSGNLLSAAAEAAAEQLLAEHRVLQAAGGLSDIAVAGGVGMAGLTNTWMAANHSAFLQINSPHQVHNNGGTMNVNGGTGCEALAPLSLRPPTSSILKQKGGASRGLLATRDGFRSPGPSQQSRLQREKSTGSVRFEIDEPKNQQLVATPPGLVVSTTLRHSRGNGMGMEGILRNSSSAKARLLIGRQSAAQLGVGLLPLDYEQQKALRTRNKQDDNNDNNNNNNMRRRLSPRHHGSLKNIDNHHQMRLRMGHKQHKKNKNKKLADDRLSGTQDWWRNEAETLPFDGQKYSFKYSIR